MADKYEVIVDGFKYHTFTSRSAAENFSRNTPGASGVHAKRAGKTTGGKWATINGRRVKIR